MAQCFGNKKPIKTAEIFPSLIYFGASSAGKQSSFCLSGHTYTAVYVVSWNEGIKKYFKVMSCIVLYRE